MPHEADTPTGPRPTSKFGLRLRILAIALTPALVGISLLSVYFAKRNLSEVERELHDRGQHLAQHLSDAVEYELFVGNMAYLRRLLNYERQNAGALAIGVSDEQGRWRVASGDTPLLGRIDPAHPPADARMGERLYFAHAIGSPESKGTDPYLVEDGRTSPGGHLVVVLDAHALDLARTRILLASGGWLLLFLGVAGGLAWRLSSGLSHQLHALTGAVRRIASGELSVRVDERSGGEMGILEQDINHMATSLEDNRSDLERRIREATAELTAQKQSAEAAVLAKSKFLAAASHDLRQPLHALTLLVAALRERIPESEAGRLVRHIETSALTMESLLNALLDLSRLDAGVVQVRPECFPVNRLFTRLEQQFAPLALEKGLRLRILPSRLSINSDPALLERILANLLSNAIRYTDRGSVLLGVRRARGDRMRLEIHDTGRGIPQDFQDKVFEEYFQLDNPERDRDKGLGLGLAIVQRLSRLLDSPVEIRATSSRGSCFSVCAWRCEPGALAAAESEHAQMPQTSLQGALVAIVDDDQAILEAMAELFEMWGMELAAGSDAEQVRLDLEALGRKPDAILSDFRLPGAGNGISAIQRLRQAFGLHIPAAIVTGDTAPEAIQAISQASLPVLHKPIKPAQLRAFLSHLLAGRQAVDGGEG